jgi:hypothetical protein
MHDTNIGTYKETLRYGVVLIIIDQMNFNMYPDPRFIWYEVRAYPDGRVVLGWVRAASVTITR